MSAKYDSTYYDAAAKKYEEAARKYTGENALNSANAQGTLTAAVAGRQAAKDATAAARSAGMSKSQAALGGMGAASQAAANNFQAGLNAAMQNNQNAIQAQQALLAGEQHKDDQNLEAKKANQDAWVSGVGSALGAGAQVGSSAVGATIASGGA